MDTNKRFQMYEEYEGFNTKGEFDHYDRFDDIDEAAFDEYALGPTLTFDSLDEYSELADDILEEDYTPEELEYLYATRGY